MASRTSPLRVSYTFQYIKQNNNCVFYSKNLTNRNPITTIQTHRPCHNTSVAEAAMTMIKKTTADSSSSRKARVHILLRELDSTNTNLGMGSRLVSPLISISKTSQWTTDHHRMLENQIINSNSTREDLKTAESASINSSLFQSCKVRFPKWKTVKEILGSWRINTDILLININKHKLRNNIWSKKTWKESVSTDTK